MSIKSQKRSARRAKMQPESFALPQQKAILQVAMLDWLYSAIFSLVVTLIVTMVAFTIDDQRHRSGIFLYVVPLLLALASVFLWLFLRRWQIYRQIKSIQYSTGQAVPIRCRKVSFLLRPVSNHAHVILCILFRDEAGDAYCYIYPTVQAPSDLVTKQLRSQLQGKNLTLTCYVGTHIVKDFPDVPIG